MPAKVVAEPFRFPNPKLFVLYADVVRYIQYRLKIFGHGQLKEFCQQFTFPYTTVVSLKNGTLKRKEHRLIQRILAALSFDTTASQNPVAQSEDDRYLFLFPGQAELQQFKDQLAIIDQQGKTLPG